MRLLFRQRFFPWFDSYDIYDERESCIHGKRTAILGALFEDFQSG